MAARWPFTSSVVTAVSPTIGRPLSRSSDWERLRSDPVRIEFSDRSRPVRALAIVEYPTT
jgi:hypothetical protein